MKFIIRTPASQRKLIEQVFKDLKKKNIRQIV